MLPEQRGLFSSWLNRFRSRSRGRGHKSSADRQRGYARLTHLEALEDRRLLTATLYVDFGERLGNVTLPEDTVTDGAAGWSTLGLAITAANPVDWVFGPEFPYAGNPNITYTPFAVPQNLPTTVFDPGPNPAGSPIQFPIGPTLPLSVQAAVENSILEILAREVAPFDMNVELETSPNLAAARALLASNNRLTDPNQVLANPPNQNLYNLTTDNPKGFVPPGFDGTRVNTQAGFTYAALGSPVGTQDVYILIGGWTMGGQDIGGPNQTNSLGFSEPHGFTTTIDPNDPLFGTNMMAMPPTQAVPITYSDAAVAVDGAQILQRAMAGTIRLNTGIATIAAQMAAITYGGEYVFTDPTTMAQTEEELFHTNTGVASPANPFNDGDVNLLSGSDIMREGPAENGLNPPAPSLDDVAIFTRYPLMIGDGNQDPTLTQNAYDYLADDPDVGQQLGTDINVTSGFPLDKVDFVTGTGAFDHVAIADDPANPGLALVTVDAYRDNTFSPSAFISEFTYDIDLTPGTSPLGATIPVELLVELGNSDDQIDIDPNTTNLAGTSILIFGGGGSDNISLLDNGSNSVSITPENVNFFEYSQVERFETTIDITNNTTFAQEALLLDEFDATSLIHLEGFSSLTYTMPEFLGDNFSLTSQAGSALGVPPTNSAVDMILAGTAGPTVASPLINVCSVEFTDIPDVLIQTPIGNSDDTFDVVTSDLGFSDFLTNLEINLGPGDDTLNLTGTNFTMPGPTGNGTGGTFTYDGGLGNDTINATGDTDWNLSDTEITGAASGLDLICENVEVANITGGDSGNIMEVDSWAGTATLNGLGGNDTFIIGDATSSVVSGNITVFGGDGNDTFYVNSYVPGFDPTTGIINTLTLSGDAGNDVFNIGRNQDLNTVAGGVIITGGTGVDTLNLDDSNSSSVTPPPPAGTGRTYFIANGSVAVGDSGGFGGVTYQTDVENVVVTGTTQDDTFNVTPSRTTTITVNGNDPQLPLPSGSNGDSLQVDFSSVQGQQLTRTSANSGHWSFTSGQKPVNFNSIEVLQLFNPLANVPLIATAAAAGSGSKPLVKIYNATTNALLFSFYAFEQTFTGGVHVSLADVFDSSGTLQDVDVVVSSGSGRVGEVKDYSGLELLSDAAAGTHLVANPDLDLISNNNPSTTTLTTVKGSTTATVPLNQPITGSNNIPNGTTFTIKSATSIVLGAKATATGTTAVTIGDVTLTLKTTKGSTAATVSSIVSVGDLVVGQSFVGANSSVTINTSKGSKTATVSDASELAVGEAVSARFDTGDPVLVAGTTITAIVGNTITLSTAALNDSTGTAALFDQLAANTSITAFKLATTGITVTLSSAATASATSEITSAGFLPEGAAYKTGLYVATGNLDGNGPEIVTSRITGTPMVRAFYLATSTPVTSPITGKAVAFNPYTSKFTTGAQIAVGDVDGDGLDEIVTVPGTGQTTTVEEFNVSTLESDLDFGVAITPEHSFVAFTASFKGSASITLGDVNGDGVDEIMLGAGTGGASHVQIYDGMGDFETQFSAFTTGTTSAALQVAAVNVNGTEELFVGQSLAGKTHLVEGFSPLTGKLVDTFMETDPAMAAGLFLG